jgi:hypothetical protein
MQAGRMVQRITAILRWLFTPAAVLFLAWAAYGSRDAFQAVVGQAHAAPIAGAVVLWAVSHLVTPVLAWLVLREGRTVISYKVVLGIHARRLPSRYLPGGIWHTVSRMTDLHRMGISRTQLSTLVLMENLIPLGVAMAIGGLLFCLTGDTQLPMVGAVFGGVLLLASTPLVVRHRLFLDKGGLAPAPYFASVLVVTGFWTIAATAFASYWLAFPGTDVAGSLFRTYGAYLLAWAAGFAAVFAPQGIGVFEWVAGLLLPGTLPIGGIAVLVAGFRAVTLAGDFLAYGVFLICEYAIVKRSAVRTNGV